MASAAPEDAKELFGYVRVSCLLWRRSKAGSYGPDSSASQVSDQEATAIAGSLGLDGEEFADQYLQARIVVHETWP